MPEVKEGEAINPDLILHANQDILVELLSSTDFNAKIVKLMNEEKMWIEVISDEKTLAMPLFVAG